MSWLGVRIIIPTVTIWSHVALSPWEAEPANNKETNGSSTPWPFFANIYSMAIWMLSKMSQVTLGHIRISMVVGDALAPSWRQGICNYHDDADSPAHVPCVFYLTVHAENLFQFYANEDCGLADYLISPSIHVCRWYVPDSHVHFIEVSSSNCYLSQSAYHKFHWRKSRYQWVNASEPLSLTRTRRYLPCLHPFDVMAINV